MDQTTLALQQQLRDSMDDETETQIKAHQEGFASIRPAAASRMAAGATPPAAALVMLAHGDSWFDYPLAGNSISLPHTDIIVQLGAMGNINPYILNMSQSGDATKDEMSLPKQQLMISALQDPANWMSSGKPDAILFSGGGNDVAGDQFCIFLDYATLSPNGLDDGRFQDALSMVEASYTPTHRGLGRNSLCFSVWRILLGA